MRLEVDKKRLIWLLVLIFFFFGNLVLLAILIINGTGHPRPAPPATATSAPR